MVTLRPKRKFLVGSSVMPSNQWNFYRRKNKFRADNNTAQQHTMVGNPRHMGRKQPRKIKNIEKSLGHRRKLSVEWRSFIQSLIIMMIHSPLWGCVPAAAALIRNGGRDPNSATNIQQRKRSFQSFGQFQYFLLNKCHSGWSCELVKDVERRSPAAKMEWILEMASSSKEGTLWYVCYQRIPSEDMWWVLM